MSSFGLNTAVDFFQKLRQERAHFIQSGCLDPRHALNAIMTAYHLCEWVFPELSGRPDFPHRNLGAFREALKEMADSPIADAGRITNGRKHFKQDRIITGEHKGLVQPNDNRGEILTGCSRCNVWWPLNKPPVRLSEEDLLALRTYAGERRQKSTDPEPNGGYEY